MVTQAQYEAIPDVSEQTELPEPIKVRWSGEDRRRVRRGLRAAAADGYMEKAVALPVMTRQKTQIVIKTKEELEAFRGELSYKAKYRVANRIGDEIHAQLQEMYDVGEPEVMRYDPPLQNHPCYPDEEVDFDVDDCVELLHYRGREAITNDVGLTVGEIASKPDGTVTGYMVREIDGFRVKVAQNGRDDKTQWVPRDRIAGTDLRRRAEIEYRREKARRRRRRIEQRKETDMDTLMEEVVIPHARKQVNEVWPGGTVDVDEISWFWNNHLQSCAGRAYWGGAEPSEHYDVSSPAIGLSPHYYYQHGIDELLATVRHELIHVWQYKHEEGFARGGHGSDFKQWMDDMNTDRYCKHWSKE